MRLPHPVLAEQSSVRSASMNSAGGHFPLGEDGRPNSPLWGADLLLRQDREEWYASRGPPRRPGGGMARALVRALGGGAMLEQDLVRLYDRVLRLQSLLQAVQDQPGA